MTPKEQYEARKAERQRRRMEASRGEMRDARQDEVDYLALLDMADRFVTAAERIADALEEANRPVNISVDNTIVRTVPL